MKCCAHATGQRTSHAKYARRGRHAVRLGRLIWPGAGVEPRDKPVWLVREEIHSELEGAIWIRNVLHGLGDNGHSMRAIQCLADVTVEKRIR